VPNSGRDGLPPGVGETAPERDSEARQSSGATCCVRSLNARTRVREQVRAGRGKGVRGCPQAERAPPEGALSPRARQTSFEGAGLSPRARRTPPEGALSPRARRTSFEGAGLSPRARRTPPEGVLRPRARRTSFEGRGCALERGGPRPRERLSLERGGFHSRGIYDVVLAGRGGHQDRVCAVYPCQVCRLSCVYVFSGFKRVSPRLFRGPLGLSPTVITTSKPTAVANTDTTNGLR
jgi:hypothetical protein